MPRPHPTLIVFAALTSALVACGGRDAEQGSPGSHAVVDLRVDASGIPSRLSIDHVPHAIDDEECYTVTGLHLLDD